MSLVLISGATGGIGKAFTKELASRGENLFLTGRSQEKLAQLKSEIEKEFSVSVQVFACDLTNPKDIESLFNYADEKGIKFHSLINVAGVDTQKPFIDYSFDKIVFQSRVNTESAILLTNGFLKRRVSGGNIITISSMSGATPMPYFALYSATKSMLLSFFTALYYELRKEKIKITTVMPAGVYTRADVVEEIKTQGLWGKLTAKTPEFIAKASLKANKKGKLKYIPGFYNKLLNFFIKLAPKRIVLRFIAKRWKSHSKDAF